MTCTNFQVLGFLPPALLHVYWCNNSHTSQSVRALKYWNLLVLRISSSIYNNGKGGKSRLLVGTRQTRLASLYIHQKCVGWRVYIADFGMAPDSANSCFANILFIKKNATRAKTSISTAFFPMLVIWVAETKSSQGVKHVQWCFVLGICLTFSYTALESCRLSSTELSSADTNNGPWAHKAAAYVS